MATDNVLLEFVQGDTVDSVDRENCIIYGAKVLGTRSKNPPPHNNLYPATTRSAALPMIEGLAVGINHPAPDEATKTRPYQDLNGCLRKPRDTADGTRADWHLNPKHPLTEQILWDAANNPRNLAFSINAQAGSKRQTDDGMVVESIERFESVDLVSRGATTNGIFESQRIPMKRSVKVLIESLKAKRPGYSRALKEMAEAGLMTPDTQMDEPAGDAPAGDDSGDADHEVALKQGFKGAMGAVLDDDSMDMKAKLAKLKEIMTAQEKLLKKPDAPAADDKPADDSPAVESLKLQNRALHLLMEANLRPDKVLSKAIQGCKTEAEVKELIEASRNGPTHRGARSAAAGTAVANGKLTESKIPEKAADWGKSLIE